jgi:hypothetical protein
MFVQWSLTLIKQPNLITCVNIDKLKLTIIGQIVGLSIMLHAIFFGEALSLRQS